MDEPEINSLKKGLPLGHHFQVKLSKTTCASMMFKDSASCLKGEFENSRWGPGSLNIHEKNIGDVKKGF